MPLVVCVRSAKIKSLASNAMAQNPMYYDDNFGSAWADDIETNKHLQDFFYEVQMRSVEKVCKGCHRKVRLLPIYDKCHVCNDRNVVKLPERNQ